MSPIYPVNKIFIVYQSGSANPVEEAIPSVVHGFRFLTLNWASINSEDIV